MIGGIIGFTIVFGFVILVLTGQGILTKAVFELSDIPINSVGQDTDALNVLDAGFASANPTLSADQIKQIKNAYPTKSVVSGSSGKQIDLSGANLILAKIALLTFWIIIAIMLFGFKFIF